MSLNDEQPTSRRAARMVERERAARDVDAAVETPPTTGTQTTADLARPVTEVPAAPVTSTEPAADAAPAGPVVTDAIFGNASWARPEEIAAWAPPAAAPADVAPAADAPVADAPAAPVPIAEPAQLVRRRDLRGRASDAPPVDLTGEIVIDPAALAAPPAAPPVTEAPVVAAPAFLPPVFEAPVAAPPAAETPAVEAPAPAEAESPAPVDAPSVFAAPAAGAAPSWAGAAAPTSAAVDAVEDAPGEQTLSRRAMRAASAPDVAEIPDVVELTDDGPTSTMPPRTAAGWSAPDGHWSRQLEADIDDEPFESTFSRQVGSTAPATNALVIPTAQPLDLSGPLTATGEIMLTGSIKLPDAFARTGATDQVDLADRDDLDDLFDDGTPLEFPVDSMPIRAAAAVSGEHVLGSPIVSTVKPGRGNKVLTGLLIAASSLAVVVTGLIIAAFAFGVV